MSDEPKPIEHKPPRTTGEALVEGERWKDYGDPLIRWERISRVWSAILGVHVEPHKAILCMVGMKMVSEAMRHKLDNIDDLEGYTEILRRFMRE